jgi:hypothetical protein
MSLIYRNLDYIIAAVFLTPIALAIARVAT